jgi:hypothetical protein
MNGSVCCTCSVGQAACAIELEGWRNVGALLKNDSLLREVSVLEGRMMLERKLCAEQIFAEQAEPAGGGSFGRGSCSSNSSDAGGRRGISRWQSVSQSALLVAGGVVLGIAGWRTAVQWR